MKSLVIGNGQIGSALVEILMRVHEVYVRDVEDFEMRGCGVLHIAYPYSDDFVEQTLKYIGQYKPILTMVHSTVAIGTTEKLGKHVVHTPERGRHPNLAEEMLVYTKFIGGSDSDDCEAAAVYFRACGWDTKIIDDSKITEALKLISNVHMGLEIAWRQELDYWGVNPGAYTAWEDSYYRGYIHQGNMKLIRPRMDPDPIGGHCILSSVEILKKAMFASEFLKLIERTNERTTAKSQEAVS